MVLHFRLAIAPFIQREDFRTNACHLLFFGIYIRRYHADHPPAHFHAEYQGSEAFVSIETGLILEGHLPAKAAHIVREWTADHRGELLENWTRARNLEPLIRIAGADND
jgi:hypothetical protein